MASSIAERNLAEIELPVLMHAALTDIEKGNAGDLDRVVEVTRLYEEIALRAAINEDAVTGAIRAPETRARFFQLIAYGAAALGGLLLQSMDAEEKSDLLQREKVDEVGSRLQHVTIELARLASKE